MAEQALDVVLGFDMETDIGSWTPFYEGLTKGTPRLLDLLAEGKTNCEIAAEMYLAEKTVKNYVSNLLAKLGMSRRTEAAALSARLEERHRNDT